MYQIQGTEDLQHIINGLLLKEPKKLPTMRCTPRQYQSMLTLRERWIFVEPFIEDDEIEIVSSSDLPHGYYVGFTCSRNDITNGIFIGIEKDGYRHS